MSDTATAVTDINKAVDRFEKTIKEHSIKVPSAECRRLQQQIAQVAQSNPTAFTESSVADYMKRRAKVLEELVDRYIVAKVGEKYPFIDPALFNLKRKLATKFANKKMRVVPLPTPIDPKAKKKPKIDKSVKVHTVDLFCYVPLDGDLVCSLLDTSTRKRISVGTYYEPYYGRTETRYGTRTTRSKIRAKLPGGFGPNLQRDRRAAIAALHEIWSELLADPVVGEYMTASSHEFVPEVEFGAIWIPTEKILSTTTKITVVKDDLPPPPPPKPEPVRSISMGYDPAMIFTLRGHRFLVKLWQVDEELPLENYLREFTTGMTFPK